MTRGNDARIAKQTPFFHEYLAHKIGFGQFVEKYFYVLDLSLLKVLILICWVALRRQQRKVRCSVLQCPTLVPTTFPATGACIAHLVALELLFSFFALSKGNPLSVSW